MKFFARWGLMGSGLGLLFLTAAPSFANTVETLNTGGTGTVTVTPLGITFTENDPAGGGSSTEVGVGTTLSDDGVTLAPGQPIDITATGGGNTVTPATLPATLTFPDEPDLSITLTSFGPGSSNSDCVGLMSGESCSPTTPYGPSPIILTAAGNTGTTAILPVAGFETVSGVTVADVSGNFSANIANDTPEQLQASAVYTTTYSGQLTLNATSVVPEPRQISIVVLAGLLMGLVVSKRKKSEA
jgi:hypothetical protein